MREDVQRVIDAVSAWEGVVAQAHQFGGIEFVLGKIEVGHVHVDSGLVDIPFTRRTREALVGTGAAELHHILPESGWISYWMNGVSDAEHAVKLYRLSYLHKRYRREPEKRAAELAGLAFAPAVLASVSGDVQEAETE